MRRAFAEYYHLAADANVVADHALVTRTTIIRSIRIEAAASEASALSGSGTVLTVEYMVLLERREPVRKRARPKALRHVTCPATLVGWAAAVGQAELTTGAAR